MSTQAPTTPDRGCSKCFQGHGGQAVGAAAELLSMAAVTEGRQAQAFPSFGSDRTMIVIASRGLGAVAGALFGSVSSAVLYRADRPVLVVPRPA